MLANRRIRIIGEDEIPCSSRWPKLYPSFLFPTCIVHLTCHVISPKTPLIRGILIHLNFAPFYQVISQFRWYQKCLHQRGFCSISPRNHVHELQRQSHCTYPRRLRNQPRDNKILAERGASIHIADVQEESLNEAVTSISASGGNISGTVVSVRESWMSSVVEKHRKLGGAANLTGVCVLLEPL